MEMFRHCIICLAAIRLYGYRLVYPDVYVVLHSQNTTAQYACILWWYLLVRYALLTAHSLRVRVCECMSARVCVCKHFRFLPRL